MRVTILGPNLSAAMQRKGDVHVHAAGCQDIARNYRGAPTYTYDVESVREVVEDFWSDFLDDGSERTWGDFLDDGSERTWGDFLNDMYFAPCVADLPKEIEPEPMDFATALQIDDNSEPDTMAEALDVVGRMLAGLSLNWDRDTFADVGPRLTCGEAESMADLLRAVGLVEDAELLICGHSIGDADDDQHAGHSCQHCDGGVMTR